ncbi:MAG: sodium:alanine symporter family protein [Acidobacteriota bacterium]|jgi:AGCS family alanine or glycine:cation symporter
MDFLSHIEELLRGFSDFMSYYVWEIGVPVGDETIPGVVIALLGTGLFLTLRLGFIQIRRIGHGFAVTSGKYDDPDEPGDVSHFQALTTALSATVGIGNIAGVAIAIHWGGPGALFWMWATAFLGMATKYSEVTLAQHYRNVEGVDRDPRRWEGTVSGGPMYYIEKGLGRHWKFLAVYFAFLLAITAFLTGNAAQANTVADALRTEFAVPKAVTGIGIAAIVAAVILGGITRIGRVTAVLAPVMAVTYVLGALTILLLHYDHILPTLALIFREAFNPSAGVAGTGIGAVLVTMMWGVRRGLFSNEAGQGSAPIAHAAAKTDEPVSEGVVALLEPFIDTIVICTMTGLVIISTGVWTDRPATELTLDRGDLSWVVVAEDGRAHELEAPPEEITVVAGRVAEPAGSPRLAWHEVVVDELFVDPEQTEPFTGRLLPGQGQAVTASGETFSSLYGPAAESGAPLTTLAFERGLGRAGRMIVVACVFLFAISTAISWSYYGDRCANYLFGGKAVLPYKLAFVVMHFLGAVLPLSVVWDLGDIFLGMVILPNLLALLLLSPKLAELTRSYFERRPWIENAAAHRRWKDQRSHRPEGDR